MRLKIVAFVSLAMCATSGASAATIIVYTDPMTLDRQTVVYKTPGPDRAFLCMAPPAAPDCVRLRLRRG